MNSYSSMDEQSLLYEVQTGNERAFTELYSRYWEKLLAIGYYYTRQKQAAEDVVHDVLISLWTRRDQLAIRSLEAYLATAVKFAVFKALARQKRQQQTEQEQVVVSPQAMPPEELLEAKFLQDFVNGVVEQMPEKARLVFKYSRHEHLTITEVAGKMKLSPKAVEYHMTRALRTLRTALQKVNLFCMVGLCLLAVLLRYFF